MLGVSSILTLMASFPASWIHICVRGQEQASCLPLTIAVTLTYPSDHRRPRTPRGELAALVRGPPPGQHVRDSCSARVLWPGGITDPVIWLFIQTGRWAQVPCRDAAPS